VPAGHHLVDDRFEVGCRPLARHGSQLLTTELAQRAVDEHLRRARCRPEDLGEVFDRQPGGEPQGERVTLVPVQPLERGAELGQQRRG
jgi:hypothetical protein